MRTKIKVQNLEKEENIIYLNSFNIQTWKKKNQNDEPK